MLRGAGQPEHPASPLDPPVELLGKVERPLAEGVLPCPQLRVLAQHPIDIEMCQGSTRPHGEHNGDCRGEQGGDGEGAQAPAADHAS